MSVESMALALHHSRAQGIARLVLLGIANHDGDGGAWPAIETLAWYAGGANRRTVQRAIKDLQELGELGEIRVMAGGTRDTPDYARPNLYEFALRCPANCDGTKNHRQCKRCGDEARQSKTYVCPACRALSVDNPEAPRGLGTTPRSGDHPPRGLGTAPPRGLGTARTIHGTHPENTPMGLSVVSPEQTAICWSCGQDRAPANARYCTTCSSSGLAQPWIDCAGGCGHVRKRNSPGQQTYTCKSCQKESTPA